MGLVSAVLSFGFALLFCGPSSRPPGYLLHLPMHKTCKPSSKIFLVSVLISGSITHSDPQKVRLLVSITGRRQARMFNGLTMDSSKPRSLIEIEDIVPKINDSSNAPTSVSQELQQQLS